MKKLFTLIVVALAMCSSNAFGNVVFGNNTLSTSGEVTSSIIKSGKVTFDVETNTLTFDNVEIDGYMYINGETGTPFTLNLIGDNTFINSASSCPISIANCNMIISSTCDGTIKFEGTRKQGFEQYNNSPVTLTIKDCSVEVTGPTYGLLGFMNGANTAVLDLVVDNASLSCNSTSGASYATGLTGVKSVTLKDCVLKEPTEYHLNNGTGDLYYFDENGSRKVYHGPFIVEKQQTSTKIDKTVSSVAQRNEIFNINGQRLSAPTKGLNIIGGKKVVVK